MPKYDNQWKLDEILKLISEVAEDEENENRGTVSIELVWHIQDILDGADGFSCGTENAACSSEGGKQ
jgi:hypothetical protein|tara:strand:- start:281 stop:481 length:201 start_codon:yes stop_codon:yes gene_type:complete